MDTLTNSEDPGEILHNVTFHQNLLYLLVQKMIFRERNFKQFLFEIITCEPLIYIMNHLKFIRSNQKEESIHALFREGSGLVVECLTGDRGPAGSSLTVITASLSKTHLS